MVEADWQFPDLEETYTVLWRRDTSPAAENLIAKYLGEELPAPSPDHHLGTVQGDAGGLSQLWSLDGLELYAESFPTHLVEPLDSENEAEAEPGWGLAAVEADKCSYSGEGVIAGILDTGIDDKHVAFTGMDLDIKDFSGAGAGDPHGHGTHCAGTFFGRDVDGVRIGVATGIKRALIGRVFDEKGRGSSEMIFKGLQWAIDGGAEIISMSLGIDYPGQVQKWLDRRVAIDFATSLTLDAYRRNLLMFDALLSLARKKDAGDIPLIVAAAGNGSRRNLKADYRLPVSFPAVIADLSVAAVGATPEGFSVAPFSNGQATISGPGLGIVSARTGGGLVTMSGTSMACPHVAGVAALWSESLREKGPDNNAESLKSFLTVHAKRDRLKPEWNRIDFGKGLVTAP